MGCKTTVVQGDNTGSGGNGGGSGGGGSNNFWDNISDNPAPYVGGIGLLAGVAYAYNNSKTRRK